MLALRLAFSKGISDVPLLRISSRNYEGCLIRRYLGLPTRCPQTLKKGHRGVISIPSVRSQTDGTSKNGVNESKQEYRKTGTSTTEVNDIDTTTNLDKESLSSTNDDDGKLVISFDYQAGIPLHHQLKKCMEDKTLTIIHTKGKEVDMDDPKFSWPFKPKRKAKKLFKEDEKLIEEARALAEYLLLPRQLKSLRSVKKRNAYRNTDKKYVTMYSVSDLRQKTIEVWGSMQRMQNLRVKHNYNYQDNDSSEKPVDAKHSFKFFKDTLWSPSGRVVLAAIAANVLNAGFKGLAWNKTGSDSMFAEMIHSLTDALNQIFMLFGLYISNKAPDSVHPYGHNSAKYLFSFVAGIGIFFFGGFINCAYGIIGLLYNTQPYLYSVWALGMLITTTCTEGGSLLYAIYEAKKKMGPTETGIKGFRNFIEQGVDPSMAVVIQEDFASVLGNFLALGCYYLGSTLETSLIWVDSLGSLMIGGLLGTVGIYIMRKNYSAILEKSVPLEVKEAIQNTMESDRIVRSVHDMKVVNNRVKAEIDFNGREITRQYLSEQDIKAILEELQFMSNEEEAKEFLVDLGDGVINQLGKGVDGLETKIKARHPQVRHVDLESL
ncbi:zinc transporter 9-like [Mizuhopecten yessoensis]|uniref:Proton-coupled zinc antiporter SLC30A9, mitochondrial n=1 Tax=Mizuhopecten yessoensis TaxID=6573 RepID=A0A210Q981_MIZYE|nr:zinc transporter 9-like [Mizuhopecten yessoensis]XP_021364111.1 zinc transporter 9-like [Mizuhopecten yessoensis]OWF45288.1 Zinc transporter 9 [Mizuhopecten yessoensis]